MEQKVWHIERPKESRYSYVTSVYCNANLKRVAPYFLPIVSIIEHAGNITVCEDCWNNATSCIRLQKEP